MTSTLVAETLRRVAPQATGALARRYGNFADAEDAVQEAMVNAIRSWGGAIPDDPLGWVIRVASRRLIEGHRRAEARRRREELAASWSRRQPEVVPEEDDTLILTFMCCHPMLTPGAAIPLTLRAVGGLTTREIAAAFLVPEPTMAQRISRAKARVADESFSMPPDEARAGRLAQVLHVLYLIFNEGYTDTARGEMAAEAIHLTRSVAAQLPDDPEVNGLLALMLLDEARRPARTGTSGQLVPLSQQDRGQWDRALIDEGVAVLDRALSAKRVGEYQLQAAIAAAHDRAAAYADTDWAEIASLYELLERLTGNPMVTLNRAVAVAMLEGPAAGLAMLAEAAATMGEQQRVLAVRAHMHEMAGSRDEAIADFVAAARLATDAREQQYLVMKAATLRH